jgi:regulatory protein
VFGSRKQKDFNTPPRAMTREDAMQYAVRALSARSLTEHELRRKLRARNASEEIANGVLERLRQLKFIDDAVIASRTVEDPALGRFGIQRKLSHRGVAKPMIEDALVQRDTDTELETALALVERHNGKWTGERAYHKASAFLMRRGFSGDVTRRALADWAIAKKLEAEDVEDPLE